MGEDIDYLAVGAGCRLSGSPAISFAKYRMCWLKCNRKHGWEVYIKIIYIKLLAVTMQIFTITGGVILPGLIPGPKRGSLRGILVQHRHHAAVFSGVGSGRAGC